MLYQNKNPYNKSIIDPTSNSEYSYKNVSISSENSEPSSSQEPENDLLLLCKQKKSNHDRLIFSTLDVNSIPNKLDDIRITIADFVDILVITESKLDQSFPDSQFFINRFSKPFRKDRHRHCGRLLMYIREDIPRKELSLNLQSDIEIIIIAGLDIMRG